jgi:hypothetical protein
MKGETMDKYERVYNWTMVELDNTINNYPIDQNIKDWLTMLKGSMEYNLNKTI